MPEDRTSLLEALLCGIPVRGCMSPPGNISSKCSEHYQSFTSLLWGASQSKPWNGGLGFVRSCDDFVVLERISICAFEQGQSTKRGCCSSSRICIYGSRCHSFRKVPWHSISASKWICRNSSIVLIGVNQPLGSNGCLLPGEIHLS